MTYTSLIWLAIMISIIGVYWLLPKQARSGFIVISSISFLAYISWISALYLTIFTIGSYVLSCVKRIPKLALITSVVAIVGVVAFYKSQLTNSPTDLLHDLAMPIGMSYYAFRVIHYLIDKYRNILPAHGFYDYICYLFFIPTLLVGPIHRFTPFYTDHQNIQWKANDLSTGIERILIGYFKIVVIGNFIFSKFLALQIGSIDPSNQSLILYLEAVRGSLNLYIQFSGYSDIAIGFAMTLGYRVMENFNNPFMKTNIAEFWRSWHISLTSWSRDYIYMSMVGLTRNPYLATLVSLTAVGIWHEVSLRYIIWGFYHGLGIIFVNKLQKYIRKRRKAKGIKNKPAPDSLFIKFLKIFATANYFFFGYIIINQESLMDTLRVYSIIFFGWMK